MAARIAVVHAPAPNDYVQSVQACGGEPVAVHWSSADVARVLDAVDGVLLTGGADVDPRLYGEEPHPTYQEAEPGRDAFEIELIRLSLERDVPLLAVCRGVQVLNVTCGGTLWQDLPSQVPTRTAHQVTSPRDALAHEIELVPGSRLDRLLERSPLRSGDRISVNSRHHQAVKHLAPGLVVCGTSTDGVIEAVERPESRFCVGVQWHPENFWRTAAFESLFGKFAAACERNSP